MTIVNNWFIECEVVDKRVKMRTYITSPLRHKLAMSGVVLNRKAFTDLRNV
jgi:hypothetical protein